MDNHFQTLSILAEVLVAFVAFTSIVASIKLTVGEELSPFQRLLIHYFIESGMLAALIALMPLVLWNSFLDERLVTQITGVFTLISTLSYLLWYLRRRAAINVPTPWTSAAIILGWFLWLPAFAMGISGRYWEPTLVMIEATVFWALIGTAVVFITFLKTFLDPKADP